jgi:hypothetical protein
MNERNEWEGPRFGCTCTGPCDCGEASPYHYAEEAASVRDLCLDCGEEVNKFGKCTRCKANHY